MTLTRASGQQAGTKADNVTSITLAYPGNVTAGNLLVIGVAKWGTANDPFVVGDISKSAGGATLGAFSLIRQSRIVPAGTEMMHTAVFTVPVTGTGSCTITVGGALTGSYLILGLEEINSSLGSTFSIAGTSAGGAASGAPDSGNVSVGGAGLFFGALTVYAPSSTLTEDGAFTLIYENQSTGQNGAFIDRIVSAATTDSASWTAPTGTPWTACLVVIREGSPSADEARGLYAQKITDTLANSTVWMDVATLAAGQFVAGKKYLIVVEAYLASSSATNDALARLVHGPTPTEFVDSLADYDYTTATTQRTCVGWLFVWDQPGTPEDVTLQIRSSSTNITTCALGQIFCLKLSDDFTTDDWKYNEVLADYTTTASRADTSSTEAASVTFTPNGTDDWLIIGNFYLRPANATTNYQGSLFDSVEGVDSPLIDMEGEDVTNDLRSHLLMRGFTPSAVSHTVQLRFSHETNACVIRSSRIFAINLNKFAQHAFSYAAADDTPAATPSWTTTRTLSPTPTTTGNWFVMGYLGNDIGTNTDNLAVRLQINPAGGGLASNPAYGDDAPGTDAFDPSDVLPFSIFTFTPLTSGAARDINLGVQRVAGTTVTVQDRCLVAFSIALAVSGVTVAPAPASAIGRVVAPTAVLGSLALAPAARSAIGRVVAPTVVLGSLALAPAARSAIGRVVAPTVEISSPPIQPAPAAAVGRVLAPGVVLGSVVVANAVAAAIGRTVSPTVVLGSLALTPGPASAVGRGVAPTVEISGGAGPSPVRRRIRWIYMHWRRFSRWT